MTVNKEMYVTSFIAFGMRSEGDDRQMENQQLVSPAQQCSSKLVSFRQGSLRKQQHDNTGASPTHSWLGSSRFLPVPAFESALKGRRFCDASDMFTNVTEEPKRFAQNGFQECFLHIYSSLQKCIVAQGSYLEGNLA
jgi:hypothetical protein